MCAKIRGKQYIFDTVYAVSVLKAGGNDSTTGTMLKKFLQPRFPVAETQTSNLIKVIYSDNTVENQLEPGTSGEGC